MSTTATPPPKKVNHIGLEVVNYKGSKTTLCAGCGHNSVSERIVECFYDLGVQPWNVAKFSGIGCSSKSPAYFLGLSHGFNGVHGRMPAIATGALLANRTIMGIGVTGDGDTASIGLGIAGYSDKEADPIEHKILDRVSAMPGIKVAALSNWLPLSFNGRNADVYPENYVPQLHESHEVRRADVTAGYFSLMGIPITTGRDFTVNDNRTAPPVVIVDQTLANRYWPGESPLGRCVKIWGRMYTVVGVAKNSKHQFVNEPLEPMVYRSFFQNPEDPTLMVQTTGDPDAMAAAVEEAIHQVDRQLVVFDVRSLRETTRASAIFPVMESTFAAIFAVIALVLAATGIYGVISYRTQLRTHEIGVRVALGASRADVLRLVLMQGIQLTIIGLALGLALAFGLTRFIASMLYGVSPTDPLTVAEVAGLLAVISVLACYLPAHRAMRINPVSAIREH